MEFKIGEVETGVWVGPRPRKVTIVQSQQCDRVYRKSNNTITINIDYSPEEMTTRLRALFKQEEKCDTL